MAKLPASMLAKSKAALEAGAVPEQGEPGYDEFYDLLEALSIAFGGQWGRTWAAAPVRHASALLDMGDSVQWDGLLIGVAVNQPGIVRVAIEAAEAVGLRDLLPVLRKIDKCIPAAVRAMRDPGDRLEWYNSPEGTSLAERLEHLYEKMEAFEGTFLLGVMRVVRDHPEVFFSG